MKEGIVIATQLRVELLEFSHSLVPQLFFKKKKDEKQKKYEKTFLTGT